MKGCSMNWELFCSALRNVGDFTVYPASQTIADNTFLAMVRSGSKKQLAVAGDTSLFNGKSCGEVTLCDLTYENAKALMQLVPYTKPRSHSGRPFSLGLGDRLGSAAPGQLLALEGSDVFPVLAQQSIRELNLTGRTYPEVIAAAAFGVFQAGYKNGYGADGDHLKTKDEIRYALQSGCTMITLDCSEQIDGRFANCSEAEIDAAYQALAQDVREHYESIYLNGKLPVVGSIAFGELKKTVLIFHNALQHAIDCHRFILAETNEPIDFELSIDEARNVTSPTEHFVAAMELQRAGICPASVAPHFTGEFEKGIDYQGDIKRFAEDIKVHQQIAEHFGYKLSLHSGSDKFSVFPLFAAATKGNMHVKTAGTNWLEAVRVLATYDAALFRRAYRFACEHFDEATAYYHVTTDPSMFVDVEAVADQNLSELLDQPASRQLLHITYGLLLNQPWFKQPFEALLTAQEEAYYEGLSRHISRHLQSLNEGLR